MAAVSKKIRTTSAAVATGTATLANTARE